MAIALEIFFDPADATDGPRRRVSLAGLDGPPILRLADTATSVAVGLAAA